MHKINESNTMFLDLLLKDKQLFATEFHEKKDVLSPPTMMKKLKNWHKNIATLGKTLQKVVNCSK